MLDQRAISYRRGAPASHPAIVGPRCRRTGTLPNVDRAGLRPAARRTRQPRQMSAQPGHRARDFAQQARHIGHRRHFARLRRQPCNGLRQRVLGAHGRQEHLVLAHDLIEVGEAKRRVDRNPTDLAARFDLGAGLLTAGDVTLDVGAHQLVIDGVPSEMNARQFALLAILVRNQGRVVTYSAIGRATGVPSPDAADRNAWRIAISKIRKQLGAGPRRPTIETELNVGYRLVLPSEPTV